MKETIAEKVGKELKISIAEVLQSLETPPNFKMGHIALPLFKFNKPTILAKNISKLEIEGVKKIKTKGAYVNFFYDINVLANKLLTTINQQKESFGTLRKKKKTIVLDYSHPNIAKPFGIHHLRSTVIGNAINNILKFQGFNTISVNHLGDWGTQFGMLIYAFLKWGDEKELEKDPIKYLLQLYVKINNLIEKKPEVKEEAKKWFVKLESGNKQAIKLWNKFKAVSLDEFKRIYKALDVEFDSYNGEAFYNNKISNVIEKFKEKGLTKKSEGALIIDVGEDIPPLLLLKSDGTSTYHTRDLAAALYRLEEYTATKLIYVVDVAQKLHFEQLFRALEKYGIDKRKLEHTWFGRMSFPEGSMSTRKGKVIFLDKVIEESISKVLKIIETKNPNLKKKDEIAQKVGIGALIFGDLVNDRVKNITFTWEKTLDFEGETGPYIQYTHVRANSILKKAGKQVTKPGNYTTEVEEKLILLLNNYQDKVVNSGNHYKPHLLARYLIELSQTFNEFYHTCSVIGTNEEQSRLTLVKAVKQILSNGLQLLGIKAPTEM